MEQEEEIPLPEYDVEKEELEPEISESNPISEATIPSLNIPPQEEI